MQKIVIPSTSIMITEKCTLRCKLCLAFVPYYKEHVSMTLDELRKILSRYFAIVDSVEIMSLTGGEPLLHPQIKDILLEVLRYQDRISKEIILITNGTIKFSDEILKILSQNKKIKVIINKYAELSKYAVENYERLYERGGVNTILYTDDHRYGWIDCRDHSLKHIDEESREKQAKGCAFFQGKKYVISRGRLYTCTRAAYRIQEEVIPYTEDAYIELLEETVPIEVQKEKLLKLLNAKYTVSCAYCDGLTENSIKYKAAEQVERKLNTNIKRTALNITTFCNLKCKHCLAFIPYYDEKSSMGIEEAVKILDIYFKVVDTVEHFTVTGGEPLLNTDVYLILKEVYRYENQVKCSVDFVTNGTLQIPENILELFEQHKDRTKVVLSDYGKNLSIKLNAIVKELKNRDIPYRISKFYGDDLYYNGWIDFSEHSLKWNSLEEREKNAQKCVHRVGKYFVINQGEVHCCSRSFWRIRNGIIPKIKGEYVSLLDENVSIEEKRRELMEMYDKKSSTSCAYCVGLCNDVPRMKPAEQID